MSDKKEGAIYQCDAGHWYVQSVGSGPGSWSLPFVGCPVCKLSSESKRADDMMHRGDSWREMCDELEAKLKGQSLRLDSARAAFRAADNGSNNDWCDATKEAWPVKSDKWLDLEEALFARIVEIPAPISHVGCVLCDGSGWKDIMIGAETKRLPCSGPIPVPLE